jgi:DNA-3-methyladenine glycosylase I
MLILEWAQAGLSWITVLKRRENYKKIFDDFNVKTISRYWDEKLEQILKDEWIVRNRLKVFSVRKNAQVFLEIQKEFWSFKKYLEIFTKGKIEKHRFENLKDYPTKNETSDAISRDLKKRWMSFVGSTIIYAYMQAIGLVDDHQPQCFCSKK